MPRSLWAASVFLFLGTTLLRTFLYTLYVSNSFSGCKLGVGLPACPVLLGNVRLFPAATWNTECFLIPRTLVFGLRLWGLSCDYSFLGRVLFVSLTAQWQGLRHLIFLAGSSWGCGEVDQLHFCFMPSMGTPCFIVFHFFVLHRHHFVCKLKACGNPALSTSISSIFPTALAHLVSLSHILLILAIFQTLPLALHLLRWSVISGLRCYYRSCLGCREPHEYEMLNLIDTCGVCSDYSTDQPSPVSPSPQASLFPETQLCWI